MKNILRYYVRVTVEKDSVGHHEQGYVQQQHNALFSYFSTK